MNKYLLKYNDLKRKDNEKIYLFKKGIFYIAILEDAKLLNNEFDLSLFYPFSNEINGVSFPVSSLNNYKQKLSERKIKYDIIEFEITKKKISSKDFNIAEKINKLDLSQTTPIEAFNFLYNLQKEIKK